MITSESDSLSSVERFPFFDDIRGQLRSFSAADVLRRVDRSGRDDGRRGLERHHGFPSNLVLQRRPFESRDDLFTRMRVPRGRHPWVEFDDRLDDLASGDAEIVPLEIDASGSCLLRLRHVQNETARDNDHRHHPPRASTFFTGWAVDPGYCLLACGQESNTHQGPDSRFASLEHSSAASPSAFVTALGVGTFAPVPRSVRAVTVLVMAAGELQTRDQ